MTREPVAEIGDDDYRVVRHTHDVGDAETLLRAKLGCHSEIGCCESEGCYTTGCTGVVDVGTPKLVWLRIVPCPPRSVGAAMGWKFHYWECDRPGRGAFPAVVFR